MSAARRSLPAIAFAVASALGIALVQPGLAANAYKVRQRDDVFLLPPAQQLRVMTLGYRAAATDLLWAKLILEYGLHWQDKRPFPDSTRYMDGILAIEPDFATLYEYLDTILVYPAPPGGTDADARTARRYLERGLQERPYDANVWLHYGQFVAFIAPSFLENRDEIESWRLDGARALAHAVELGVDAQRSLAASTILSKAGERRATIDHLQRAYAMTDDPQMREQFLLKLRSMEAEAEAEQAVTFVDHHWQSRYRFLSRSTALLIGPGRSPSACAGPESYEKRGCARDWQQAIDASQ